MFRFSILVALLLVSPAAADPYTQCAETQLAMMGYLATPPDGRPDSSSRAAGEALRKSDPMRARGIAFLPPLGRASAADWCRDLAAAGNDLRAVQPNYRAELVVSDSAAAQAAMRRDLTRITDYFHAQYGISLARPVAIVGSGNADVITTLILNAASQLKVHYRINERAKSRCRRTRFVQGEAHRNITWICWGQGKGPDSGTAVSRFVLAHEFVHLVQSDLAGNSRSGNARRGRDKGPAWWIEGHANWVATDYMVRRGAIRRPSLESMRRWATGQQTQLDRLDSGIAMHTASSYDIGQVAASVLIARSGPQASFDYFRRIGAKQKPAAAFRATFGVDLKTFEAQFPRIIGSKTTFDRFVSGGALN